MPPPRQDCDWESDASAVGDASEHSWESNAAVSSVAAASWESGGGNSHDDVPDLAAGSDDDSDSSCDGLASTAGDELVGCMLDLFLKRSITAKDLCTSMFRAAAAGIRFSIYII